MSENELKQFKYNFLNLRWLIVIAAAYMAVFSSPGKLLASVNFINSLVLFFIFSNVFLYFVTLELFKNKYFRYAVFIADIILVTLAIYYTRSANSDFFLLYFLVIIITALGKDLKASVIATIVASLLYFWLLLQKDVDIYDVNVYIRIPFLFVVGLFTGFLSETVKKEETHVKELRLILSITDIMNENIDHEIMVHLLDPLFEEIEVIEDWEIAVYNKEKENFLLLREDTEIEVGEMAPEFTDLLLKKSQIYKDPEYIYFPQSRGAQIIGFLRVKPRKKLLEKDIDLFMTLAGAFAIAIERNKLYEEITNLANMDRLTDLYNYGYFLEQADKRVAARKNFAVIMIDLDNFKTYNDTYGHVAGNIYLKKIADNFKEALEKKCVLARYGGDEFVVLREGKNSDISAFLKKFKTEMDAKFTEHDSKVQVTMSIGYAFYPGDGKTAEEVLTAADKGLYTAKQKGKNRIEYL